MRKQQRHGWKGEEEGNKKRRKAITRDGSVKLVIPTRRVMKKKWAEMQGGNVQGADGEKGDHERPRLFARCFR
jgi:hypothetical protein